VKKPDLKHHQPFKTTEIISPSKKLTPDENKPTFKIAFYKKAPTTTLS